MGTGQLTIRSNNGEEAIAVDLVRRQEVVFRREDAGASVEDFLKDLAPGAVIRAKTIPAATERLGAARFRQHCASARKTHEKP